jgi:hypothetical protein
MTILEALKALRDGQPLKIEERRTQSGEWVTNKALKFEDGRWLVWEIDCQSSSEFGLGVCHCNNHQSSSEVSVSRETALQLLRDVHERAEDEKKARAEEIAWLDAAIKQLSA